MTVDKGIAAASCDVHNKHLDSAQANLDDAPRWAGGPVLSGEPLLGLVWIIPASLNRPLC